MKKASKKAVKINKATSKGKAVKAVAPKAVAVKPTLQNIFREGSNYSACTLAIVKLGLNKLHPFSAIVAEVKKQMGKEALAAFAKKDARNSETGKSCNDRILQNVAVIGRKDRYGDPIRSAGYEVRRSGREQVAGIFKAK